METAAAQQAPSAKSAFDQAEILERQQLIKIFAKKGITDYEFTEIGSLDRYDFKFNYNGKTFFGDIKNRNIKSSDYKDSLIDKSKIDYLIDTGHKNDWIPMIICTYSDKVALIWYILQEIQGGKIKFEKKYCNRTTAVDNGKKMKEVALLLISNALKHKLDDENTVQSV